VAFTTYYLVKTAGDGAAKVKKLSKTSFSKVNNNLAIVEGTCKRWSSHDVPYWECQTLQCSDCKEYPVPKEEAREDADAENISFHVYEYKMSLRKDGKEQRRLELVQSIAKLVSSTAFIIGPPSDVGGTT
jgi:hypothetical protein